MARMLIMDSERPFLPYAEAALLVALARSEGVPIGRVEALLQRVIDWGRLIRLAGEHDVVPFLYHHLKGHSDVVPADVLQDLRTIYLHQFRRSIQIRGELPRLLAHLADHGIEALPFKGPVLAALAYRDENLRTFTDLDLLIRKDDVKRTIEALAEAGFKAKNPLQPNYDTTWETYAPWHRPHGNANGYVRDEGTPGALHVDIHWGLASRYFLFPMEPDALWTRRTSVTLDNGTTVSTFSPADTLLFQCMHAAKDAYYRLGHICDIAELLHTHPDLDGATVLKRARDLHSERMVLLGLRLSHELLDAPLPGDVQRRVLEHAATAQLAHRVRTALFRSRHGVSRLHHLFQFHLRVRDRMRDGLGAAYHSLRTSLQSVL